MQGINLASQDQRNRQVSLPTGLKPPPAVLSIFGLLPRDIRMQSAKFLSIEGLLLPLLSVAPKDTPSEQIFETPGLLISVCLLCLFLHFSLLLLLRPCLPPCYFPCAWHRARDTGVSPHLSLLVVPFASPSEAALLGMPMLAAQRIETGVVRLLQKSIEPSEFLSQTK